MISRSVPGTSFGPHAALGVLAEPGIQTTAPVTCPWADSALSREVLGAKATPSSLACSRSSGTMSSSPADSRLAMMASPPPRRMALRAASDADVAAADHQHLPGQFGGQAGQAGLAQELQRPDHAARLDPLDRQPQADVLAQGEEGCRVGAQLLPLMSCPACIPQRISIPPPGQLGDLVVQDLLRQVSAAGMPARSIPPGFQRLSKITLE